MARKALFRDSQGENEVVDLPPKDVCETYCVNADAVARVKPHIASDRIASRLADTFAVLGDPTRVKLISALMHSELCVCDLAALVELSQSAVSHQLRLLRTMRLVKYRRDGRVVYYSLDDQHIANLFLEGEQHVMEEGD
ncbi:MAG: ArsR/SmtB family transcription factor [Chloroflexota bacterium]|jgi:DNA-binding transcriptional ArsR family regulator